MYMESRHVLHMFNLLHHGTCYRVFDRKSVNCTNRVKGGSGLVVLSETYWLGADETYFMNQNINQLK